MAKDKERSVNPAQAQRKADKAKALKKSKAELQAKRNEKLAKRNPDRIQRQIDDLKALETAGDIKPREKAILADLERDLKAVQKARDTLGDKAPPRSTRPAQRPDQPQSTLGKRRYDGQRKYDSGSDTDQEVRAIPWPRDTPPPIPHEFRRKRPEPPPPPQSVVVAEAKTTYESAPQVRDLRKEAINRFVPNVVKQKQNAVKGHAGQLLEPDELDRLEQEGYLKKDGPVESTNQQPSFTQYKPNMSAAAQRLAAEQAAFERELAGAEAGDDNRTSSRAAADMTVDQIEDKVLNVRKAVQIEEVEDEDL